MQVVMCEPTARVPPEILQTVQHQIEEMAGAVAQLEPEGTFWASVRESGLSLEVLGWTFKFTVDGDKLVLVEANPIPPQVI
jgi:hypothetical protein